MQEANTLEKEALEQCLRYSNCNVSFAIQTNLLFSINPFDTATYLRDENARIKLLL